jgi:hypothetical protein
MIQDLDRTIEAMLNSEAAPGSELDLASISFEIPDGTWRDALSVLTVNCYLYSVSENSELRRWEPVVVRSADGSRARKIRPPKRIDCGYCITAWSIAETDPVLEEHRLLGQVLEVLMRNTTIPAAALQGSMASQTPPFPTVIAAADGPKTDPEFWGALDQRLKPSLNYIVTLALFLDPIEADEDLPPVVEDVDVGVDHEANLDDTESP